ncbi:hypothetical protein ABW636_17500 [Aquimarina sp. 2201CG1-2-11]|uniref:hypothetical protein n=1 Tax=Aquimarina discodermiae TaxID=3231043 RepID=UPI00346316B7
MIKKIAVQTNILTFAIFFFSLSIIGQEMKNTANVYKTELEKGTWITDKILGLDTNVKKYTLAKFTQRKFAGNLTTFSNKASYTSEYVSHCGNDNFTTVVGKYKFLDQNRIAISVDTVSYHGEWEKPTEYRKPEEFIFTISKSEDAIVFTRLND